MANLLCLIFSNIRMRKLLILWLVLISDLLTGQIATIPDPAFKACLLANPEINLNGDDEIQISECTCFIGGIDCSGLGISDMTGIQEFLCLEWVHCYDNQLTSLDLGTNSGIIDLRCYNNQLSSLVFDPFNLPSTIMCDNNQLTELSLSSFSPLGVLTCANNQLTSLDVSNNAVLFYLDCSGNPLTNLDLSSNAYLEVVDCSENQLTSLNLSNSSILTALNCSNNNLTSLDLRNGNNSGMAGSDFNAIGNPELQCILVDDPSYCTSNWTAIPAGTFFSEDCVVSVVDSDSSAITISVHPNPTSYFINLSRSAFVGLVDITGREIVRSHFTNTLNVSDQQSGMYFLALYSLDGEIIDRIRIIKE